MFCTDEEFRKILAGDAALFAEVLSRVHNKAIEDAMRATPELTARLIKSSLAIRTMVDDFKTAHKEFEGHDDIVTKVVQEIELANPGAVYSKVLEASVPIINARISALKTPVVEGTQPSLGDLDKRTHGAL